MTESIKTARVQVPPVVIKRGSLGTIQIGPTLVDIPAEDVTVSPSQVLAEEQVVYDPKLVRSVLLASLASPEAVERIKTVVVSELRKLEHSSPENPKPVELYPLEKIKWPEIKEKRK